MPRFVFRFVMASALSVLLAIGAARVLAEEVTVFVAASLGDIVAELAADFEAQGGAHVRIVAGASSTLARQIDKGAPADVFISANRDWADYAARALGRADVMPLFGNRLVAVRAKDARPLDAFADLPEALGGGRLAIGDPAHVPAGQYAVEALKAVGIWAAVGDRLAPASDVRGALAFVAQGAAPYGIVYATDVRDGALVAAEIDAGLISEIRYFAVTRQDPSEAVAALVDYLHGKDARAIIEGMGFTAAGG